MLNIKIVTVNVPTTYLDAIEKLIGEDGLYPSRSELIRVAVREFLLKELQMAKKMMNYNEPEIEEFDSEKFVKIPIESKNQEEPVRQHRTYKILRRLENSEGSSESGDLIDDDIKSDYKEDLNERDYVKPTLEQLRKKYPHRPEYRYINEGEKRSLLNI